MGIVKCLYGYDDKCIDVTTIVLEQLSKHNYVVANNETFTDPCHGKKKQLTIINDDQTDIIIDEGDAYYINNNNNLILKCYYHIFCNDNQMIFNIVDEQLSFIMSSPIYNDIKVVNCCISGSNLDNYNKMIDKMTQVQKQTNDKIKIHKCCFGDTSYERFTLNSIKLDDDLSNDKCYILYIHSKGITSRKEGIERTGRWRRCMMYFLLTKAHRCLNEFIKHNYDTVGIFYYKNNNHRESYGYISNDAYYAGNFWWAKATYLKSLFDNYEIGPYYYDTEQFLFKNKPNYCSLYDWRTGNRTSFNESNYKK